MSFPIEIREGRGVRTLHFGSDWVQGAMRVARPSDLELVYTRGDDGGVAVVTELATDAPSDFADWSGCWVADAFH